MIIHVVKEGDSLYKIGEQYHIDYRKIAEYNKIPLHKDLVVGQTIVVITNNTEKLRQIEVNGYAFPNIKIDILAETLPYLTYLSIFSYPVNFDGSLNMIDDEELINLSKVYDIEPIMSVTNIGSEGRFNSNLAHAILSNNNVQNKLISNILSILLNKGYKGLNIDFEYVYPSDKEAYIKFLTKVKTIIKRYNYFLTVSVAPKTSDEQRGLLYEAHDYKRIGILADRIVIMTYEWGFSGGPAMAVAPITKVEDVLNYAISRIPSYKILLGIPNYGYDWTLPYNEGDIARSISNPEAVEIARKNNQSINYSNEDQAPFFNYFDSSKKKHEVWFEDARSIQAKLGLVMKYNLKGISYWTLNNPFTQNFLVLNSLFDIRKDYLLS
jgi:spore germination protein